MVTLAALVEERTDLDSLDVEALSRIVADWSIVSDLAQSDLVLWLPTWNDGGLVAAAQVRPTTAPTAVPDDVVGSFVPRGRFAQLDQAIAFGRPLTVRDITLPWLPIGDEAYPVRRGGRVIGVVARRSSRLSRVAGQLEEIYLASADDLLQMLVDGRFPVPEIGDEAAGTPRVGDGIVRLDAAGTVRYASPNAVSAMRRMGLATDVVGAAAAETVVRLSRRHGPVDESLSAIAGGRLAGRVDVVTPTAQVLLRGVPLWRGDDRIGALLFVQDVTDLRRRERALIGKDATIREIHHRVKNNLQTVAAMLRLQARRASTEEAREALAEAELRVAAIAVVHDALSGQDGERVDFDEVADRVVALVRDLAPAFAQGTPLPRIVRRGSWGSLPADVATPLSMVASELLHNAVEHARAASIDLCLETDGTGLALRVVDDGRGLPDGFDSLDAGLGLSIVHSLVTGDLHGTCAFAVDAHHGTTVTVTVPRHGE
jgi:two-component sensor histidine kinase